MELSSKEKQDVIVYDYVDIHIPVLERMYHKRLTGYSQIGYKALASKNEPDRISMIYDHETFSTALKRDFADSTKDILISCPYIRKKKVYELLSMLEDLVSKGIDTTIITLPTESYREQERAIKNIELLQTKVKVKTSYDIYQKYVIIDKQLVWYGSIGLLDYIDSDDTIIRLESRELVEELIEDILL